MTLRAATRLGTDPRPTDACAAPRITGERTIPHVWHENYWFRRHEVVYEYLAAGFSSRDDRTILDAGSGEGYGAAVLDRHSPRQIVGLDYDALAVDQARRTYPSITVVRGNLVELPFVDQSFDALVSLQVIEHLWDQAAFLNECVRVGRQGGWVAISTPNRVTFSPGLGRREKPKNLFHTNEFDAEELVELVAAAGLEVRAILGVRHGERLIHWESEHGSLSRAQLRVPHWAWGAELAQMVRSISCADFVIDDEAPDNWLDLLVLASVPGLSPR